MKKLMIVLCIVMLVLTGCKPKPKTDTITREQIEAAEATCRMMIAAWETDVQSYKDGDIDAKASANKTAQDYNEYMQINGYLFGETLPEGLYAAIEPIE